MINWRQPKQDICWPVSCYNIRGSGQELIEVMCFLEVDRWPGTGFQLNHRHEPGYYSAERRRKYMCFFTLIPQYSLHNCLFESPWYIAYIISTILGTVMRYSVLKHNWKKKLWNHTLNKPSPTPYWNSNRAVIIVFAQLLLKACIVPARIEDHSFCTTIRCFAKLKWSWQISTMVNMKAEFHEHLHVTHPGVKHDQEMSICLLESDHGKLWWECQP